MFYNLEDAYWNSKTSRRNPDSMTVKRRKSLERRFKIVKRHAKKSKYPSSLPRDIYDYMGY